MTLCDLWLTIRHYLKWVIAVPIACALLAGGFIYASDRMSAQNCTATATLTVTDPTAVLSAVSLSNLMGSLAQNAVDAIRDETVKVTAESDATTQSVVFSASATSEDDALTIVNEVASKTIESIRQALIDQSDEYQGLAAEVARADVDPAQSSSITTADRVAALRSCVLAVSEGKITKASDSGGLIKYATFGFAGGFALVICALVFFDSVKRPIKGRGDVACVTDLPILADSSDALVGERLWVNIRFCVKEEIRSVCIIPVSGLSAEKVSAALSQAVESFQFDSTLAECASRGENAKLPLVVSCDSLKENIAGACAARGSSAVVVVVRLWEDTAFSLRDALSELELANAPVVGVVIMN